MLATLNDVRKNWTRDISLCIKLLKCKLIQILKRSLNLRDCLSHFDLKKLLLQMSLFFPFIAISSVRHPTGSNGRPALWKNDITVVSLFASCCCFIQEASHRFRKKKSTFWHNRQFAYALWMSRHWWGSRYVFIEVSVIVAGVCCLNERFFVASCLSTRKRKRI